jgi:hypothetical protein
MWHFLTLSIWPVFEKIHPGALLKSTDACEYMGMHLCERDRENGFLSSGSLVALFYRSLQKNDQREEDVGHI